MSANRRYINPLAAVIDLLQRDDLRRRNRHEAETERKAAAWLLQEPPPEGSVPLCPEQREVAQQIAQGKLRVESLRHAPDPVGRLHLYVRYYSGWDPPPTPWTCALAVLDVQKVNLPEDLRFYLFCRPKRLDEFPRGEKLYEVGIALEQFHRDGLTGKIADAVVREYPRWRGLLARLTGHIMDAPALQTAESVTMPALNPTCHLPDIDYPGFAVPAATTVRVPLQQTGTAILRNRETLRKYFSDATLDGWLTSIGKADRALYYPELQEGETRRELQERVETVFQELARIPSQLIAVRTPDLEPVGTAAAKLLAEFYGFSKKVGEWASQAPGAHRHDYVPPENSEYVSKTTAAEIFALRTDTRPDPARITKEISHKNLKTDANGKVSVLSIKKRAAQLAAEKRRRANKGGAAVMQKPELRDGACAWCHDRAATTPTPNGKLCDICFANWSTPVSDPKPLVRSSPPLH